MNIAPKQIDEVLESHPAVLEAAAVGVPDRYLGEDVVAFAVLRDGMTCDERELLTLLREPPGPFQNSDANSFCQGPAEGPVGKSAAAEVGGGGGAALLLSNRLLPGAKQPYQLLAAARIRRQQRRLSR